MRNTEEQRLAVLAALRDGDERGLAALSMAPTLVWATRLVARGVNVIPLRGKRPLRPWRRWRTERQLDLPNPAQYLLEHFFGDENLAAITGAVSGFVAYDVDSAAARTMLAEVCGGALPLTVGSETSANRWHLWFAHPGETVRNRVDVGGVDFDVRGDGGYIVTPPSIHPDTGTPYAWVTSPIEMWPPAPIPAPLMKLLQPRVRPAVARPQTRGSRYATGALDRATAEVRAAPVGQRNDRLNRTAFSIARLVASGDLPARESAYWLVAAAVTAGLPLEEAQQTVASAFGARGVPCPWTSPG